MKVIFKYDGLEAVLAASRWNYSPSLNISQFDLIWLLHELIKHMQIKPEFSHVKGHQDGSSGDIWTTMNNTADSRAKLALWESIQDDIDHPLLTQQDGDIPIITCTRGPKTLQITSNLRTNLTKAIAGYEVKRYWIKKGKWPGTLTEDGKDIVLDGEESIMGTAFEHALRNVPQWKLHWLIKWHSGFCGVGLTLHRWRDQSHSMCPRCNQPNETVHHVMVCRQDSASQCWMAGVGKLEVWLLGNELIPSLAQGVVHCLKQWREPDLADPPPHLSEEAEELIESQKVIGWDKAFFGLISTQWKWSLNLELRKRGSRRTADGWISQFIRQLWELQLAMWQHRNHWLHEIEKGVHSREQRAIDAAIRFEFAIGRNGLSIQHEALFSGSATNVLQKNIDARKSWLASVWLGRDSERRRAGLDPWHKDPLASNFLTRDKIRKKRKRKFEEDLSKMI